MELEPDITTTTYNKSLTNLQIYYAYKKSKPTQNKYPQLLELDDYHFYLNHNTSNSYTGVGIFTKEEPLNVEMGFENLEEGRVLKAEFDEFTLYNIYFPDGAGSAEKLEYKLNFYNKFLKSVQNESKTIICGDFNIAHQPSDIHNPQQAQRYVGFLKEEREKLDYLINNGFIDSFREFNKDPHNYTWWSYGRNCRENNIGMRLDYFFASNDLKNNIKDAKIRSDIIGSDHCPIELELK